MDPLFVVEVGLQVSLEQLEVVLLLLGVSTEVVGEVWYYGGRS